MVFYLQICYHLKYIIFFTILIMMNTFLRRLWIASFSSFILTSSVFACMTVGRHDSHPYLQAALPVLLFIIFICVAYDLFYKKPQSPETKKWTINCLMITYILLAIVLPFFHLPDSIVPLAIIISYLFHVLVCIYKHLQISKIECQKKILILSGLYIILASFFFSLLAFTLPLFWDIIFISSLTILCIASFITAYHLRDYVFKALILTFVFLFIINSLVLHLQWML